jgi:hypothetical protein
VQKDAEKNSSDDIETTIDDSSVRMFDITIQNEDGDEIQPNGDVSVSVQYKKAVKVSADAKMKAIHFDEKNEEVKVLTPETKADTSDTEKKVHEVKFDTNGFSVYAIVGTEKGTTDVNELTYSGPDYKITLTFDDKAGIPSGAELDVRELERGSEEYMEYYNQTMQKLGLAPEKGSDKSKDTEGEWAEIVPLMSDARFFDIRIMYEGKEIEPATTTDVKIEYTDGLKVDDDQTVKVFHFDEKAEDGLDINDVKTSDDNKKITFSQNSFSITGTGTIPKDIDMTLTGEETEVNYSSVRRAASADNGGPQTTKTVTRNDNGTYKVKINVVGKTDSTTTVSKANVIVILDTSGSMSNDGGTSYVETSDNYGTQYGIVNGQYVRLYSGTYSRRRYWYYYDSNNRKQYYTGTRYVQQTATRLEGAKSAVDSIADTLLTKNTTEHFDLVQMALISFNTTADISQLPTTDADTFKQTVNRLTASGGTNWEDALQKVSQVNFSDNDPTYVIFASDGNPTFRNTFGSYTDRYLPMTDNEKWYEENFWGDQKATDYYYTYRGDNYFYTSDKVYGLGSDDKSDVNHSETSMRRCYNEALDEAKALVSAGYQFYTIGAYGNVSWMSRFTTDAGAPLNHYYAASNSAALSSALAEIANAITNSIGFNDVKTHDGVTALSSVSASITDGSIDTFKYYKNGTEWTGAPTATYTDNTVTWDLSSEHPLEDGTTYSIEFDVWPSQASYDLIADLNNGIKSYSAGSANSITDAERAQIVDNDDGTYSLKTNTSLTTDYTRGGKLALILGTKATQQCHW